MDKTYWIGRQAAAAAMAKGASSAEIRLIHYELAGRYGVMAASCPPFMVPPPGPAVREARAVLHLPPPHRLEAPAPGGDGR
jgi:hypothetical protein